MWHGWQGDVKFYQALADMDDTVAAAVRAAGCRCGGRLHHADYPRKPRGELDRAEPLFLRRTSFCCDREGCRARTTPPSLRFLGRRVYVAAVVLVAGALFALTQRAVANDPSARARGRHIAGVPARTVRRWHAFWVIDFVASGLWKDARGRLSPPVDEAQMPASLLDRFDGVPSEKLLKALQLVSGVTLSPTGHGIRGIRSGPQSLVFREKRG